MAQILYAFDDYLKKGRRNIRSDAAVKIFKPLEHFRPWKNQA